MIMQEVKDVPNVRTLHIIVESDKYKSCTVLILSDELTNLKCVSSSSHT